MTVLCTESIQTLPQFLAQKFKEKLQMADVLYKLLVEKGSCSMQKAVVLAPSILELLSRLAEDGIDPNKIERTPWGSGVRHIDEIRNILPGIIKKWSKITKHKGKRYNIQHRLHGRMQQPEFQVDMLQDLAGIEYAECKFLREEALVVLLKTKEILQDPNKTVSIISDSPQLIKIILSLSTLWGIKIEDSFGVPLQELDEIDFMRLILETIKQNFAPVYLIALLRHKMFAFGKDDFNVNFLITELERKYLRGVRRYSSFTELIELISESQLRIFLWLLQEELKSFINLMSQSSVPAHDILKNLNKLAIRLSDSMENSVYSELAKIKVTLNEIAPDTFIQMLDDLLLGERFNSSTNEQARVKIFSLSDDKALKSDYVILTGMSEETFFKNRLYDVRIIQGIYALLRVDKYDPELAQAEQAFIALIKKRDLLLTRSSMINGTPQTPSHFLIQLELVAKKFQETRFYNINLLQEARSLYTPSEFVQSPLVAPMPSFENRLRRLSVTQIERLIRDPYSIYVSSILKLRKLKDVDKALDQIEFGKFIHKVIDRFSKNYVTGKSEQYYFKQVMFHGQLQAASIVQFPLVRTIWLTQLKKLGSWIVNFEMIKHGQGKKIKIYTEAKGEIDLTLANGEMFTLSCQADRIEITSGNATIIDFKTGGAPSKKDIFSGISPQLPLEALILLNKGFSNISGFKKSKVNLEEISYITLGAGMKFGNIISFRDNLKFLIDEARVGVKNLITFYNNANTPFLIRPNSDYGLAYNEYAHIERIEE